MHVYMLTLCHPTKCPNSLNPNLSGLAKEPPNPSLWSLMLVCNVILQWWLKIIVRMICLMKNALCAKWNFPICSVSFSAVEIDKSCPGGLLRVNAWALCFLSFPWLQESEKQSSGGGSLRLSYREQLPIIWDETSDKEQPCPIWDFETLC